MKIKTNLIVITIISGTLESLLFYFYLYSNTLIQSWASLWIVSIFCIFYLGMFSILYILGTQRSRKYLENTKKWDSPKVFGLILIIWWVFCAVIYYLQLDNGILFLAIGGTIASLSGFYMRKIYRKKTVT
jgi:hypothetical protein